MPQTLLQYTQETLFPSDRVGFMHEWKRLSKEEQDSLKKDAEKEMQVLGVGVKYS